MCSDTHDTFPSSMAELALRDELTIHGRHTEQPTVQLITIPTAVAGGGGVAADELHTGTFTCIIHFSDMQSFISDSSQKI